MIGATNRPDMLDLALLRPGRFDRIIEIPMPDPEALQEIYRIHTRKMNISSNVKISDLAAMSSNASGADIKAITTEAGMFAIREGRSEVILVDFKKAIDKVLIKKKISSKDVRSYV